MNSIRSLWAAIFFLSSVAFVSDLAAQSGASRPLRFIVAFPASGSADVYARALAVPMSKHLNQTIVIENIGGGGGNIGVARAAKAAPDGETFLFHTMGMVTSPSLYRKLDYNALTDFEYVGVVAHSTLVLVARPDLPVADLKQFISYARAYGDKITIGDAGIGSVTNLCALLSMSTIGAKFTLVSFKGDALAMNALLGGHIDLLCGGVSTTARHITAGKVKALGITSRARLPSLAEVPTLAEQGLTGFELAPWSAIYAPKMTPRPVIQRMEAALQVAISDRELIAYFDNLGLVPASRELASSAGLQAYLKAEIDKWGVLLKKAGVVLD